MFLAMVPVGAMAGLLIAAVITYVMPKMFESSAVIEITSRPKSSQGVSQGSTSSNHFGTELEVMKSRNILLRVTESLDLPNKWGMDRDSTVQILKSIIVVESIRETDLVSVKVRHTNKEDARDIAAEVVEAYKRYRMELESKSVEKMVNELKQEDTVEERRKVVPDLRHRWKPALENQDGTDLDAKRDFEIELGLLEQLKLRLITQEIEQGFSGDIIVVHEEPVISDITISPNVTLNLVRGLAAGTLISPFLALPLMALMNRRKGRDGLSEPSGSVG
jgi:capsular polysaccharide biosynthesis protein